MTPPALQKFVYDLRPSPTEARIDWLSLDTEGNRTRLPNLLQSQGIHLRVGVAGEMQQAHLLPTKIESEADHHRYEITIDKDTKLSWQIQTRPDGFTFVFRCDGASKEPHLELELAFDPRVTPTTVLPAQWNKDQFSLPIILSAPDFGQVAVESDVPMQGRFEGSRHDKVSTVVLELPINLSKPQCTLRFSPLYLPAPGDLKDHSLWPLARRGWWGNLQSSCKWGDQNHPFSAPPGILGNNVISDPASCSIWFYADQILLMPADELHGISPSHWLRHSIDWWLDARTDVHGEVTCYWDFKNFLDANAGPLIAAWDYVEKSGDLDWLSRRIEKLELIADFLARRDVDGDGLVEATQSGNLGTLWIPARSCAWWDALNCGHKDGYTNAVIYRSWRCLADLQNKLGRSEKAQRYTALADRLQGQYARVLMNEKTGWLGWWRSADGELHDYASPTLNGIAIEYGLVTPDIGRDILHRLWTKIQDAKFSRFELGIPPMLVPVRKGDYLQPDAIGCPKKDDGSDTFGVYINGGITAGHTLHFMAAHYVLGQPERADKILYAMLQRQQLGAFQNGVTDAAMKGIDWTNWQGEPTGYEGYLADSFRFLQAVLLREKPFRDKLYRPLHSGGK